MYSQRDEEKYITEHLKDIGRFLDIGAYDGKTFSNTHRLYELGWGGVCVEPSPTVFTALMKNVDNRVDLINCAIAPQSQIMPFYESHGDAVGTLSEAHKTVWQSAVNFRRIAVKTITLDELLAYVGYDFDFINIDTEGSSVDLFASLPFEKLARAKAICVEYDGEAEKAKSIGNANGFACVYQSPENVVLVR